MPAFRRTAAPLRVLAGVLVCAGLLAACGRSEVAPAPAASSGPAPEERAYRTKVIDAMRSEEGLAFAEELQQAYTALDRALIEMLYREEVRPGMTAAEATPVLRALTRRVATASRAPRERQPARAAVVRGPVVGMAGGH